MGTGASTIKTPTKVHAVNDEAVPASVKMVESSRQKGRQLNTADNAEKHAHSRQTSKERQTRYVSPHNKSANGAKERGAAISDPQFKLFRTHSNQEYTVHIKEDGKMFYVDWEDQVSDDIAWRCITSCRNGGSSQRNGLIMEHL
jgi:hypothetical protein